MKKEDIIEILFYCHLTYDQAAEVASKIMRIYHNKKRNELLKFLNFMINDSLLNDVFSDPEATINEYFEHIKN